MSDTHEHYVKAVGRKVVIRTTDPNFLQFLRCDGCGEILYPELMEHRSSEVDRIDRKIAALQRHRRVAEQQFKATEDKQP